MKAVIVTPIPLSKLLVVGHGAFSSCKWGSHEVNMYFPATVDSKPHNSGICSAALGMFPLGFSLDFPWPCCSRAGLTAWYPDGSPRQGVGTQPRFHEKVTGEEMGRWFFWAQPPTTYGPSKIRPSKLSRISWHPLAWGLPKMTKS